MRDDDEAPRRRGRPPLISGEPSISLRVRLAESEYHRACRIAQLNDRTVSDVLRHAFQHAVRRQPDEDDDEA